LKAVAIVISLVPIVFKSDAVQKTVAVVNLAWIGLYITLLFANLRY